MWWFDALHANLLDLLRRCSGKTEPAAGPLLDAGCGTGGFLAKLARAYPERIVIGLDADPFAVIRAHRKSGSPVCVGSVNALPFADGTFAAIVSADVLCHRGVDEMTALDQFRRCLRNNGVLLLNLPAYQWLMSAHDLAVANVRRYNRGILRALFDCAGFRPLEIGHWNSLLFPVMVTARKLLPARRGHSEVSVYPAAIDRIARIATSIEQRLLRNGFRVPFGGSIIAAGVKEGGANV